MNLLECIYLNQSEAFPKGLYSDVTERTNNSREA